MPVKTSIANSAAVRGVELTLARRLAWKAEGERKVSPAVGIAVAGVALAVVVMILSVSIMFGFKEEVTRRIIDLDDAITIAGYDSTFVPAEVLSVIDLPADAEVVLHASVPAILKTADDFMGLELRRNDSLSPADSVVIISTSTAAKLRLSPGDRVAAYFFINDRLRVRMLTVGETYSTGFSEHDDAVGYCAASLPAELGGYPADRVESIGVRNIPADRIAPLASEIYSRLLTAYYSGQIENSFTISTVLQTDANFFSWLSLLDTNVIVIIALMGLVAAFTLVSSLFIIILERVRTIGLLKSLGATNPQIRNIFIMMAERLVLRGLLIGNATGISLILLQNATHAVPLDPTNYYVDFVPVSLSWLSLLWLNAGALAVSWLVLLLPAMIIARISPATTMRYE